MTRVFLATALLAAILLADKTYGAQCICATVPMYPVSGGWFHYAIVVNKANCATDYATGEILPTAVVQSCSPGTCGGCSPLGGRGIVPPTNHYYATSPLRDDELDTPAKFRAIMSRTHTGINDWVLQDLRLVKLTPAMGEPFYARIATMLPTTSSGIRFPRHVTFRIGFEVTGADAADTEMVPCAVRTTYKDINGNCHDDLIPGIVQAQFRSPDDNAFIRLASSTNSTSRFSECLRICDEADSTRCTTCRLPTEENFLTAGSNLLTTEVSPPVVATGMASCNHFSIASCNPPSIQACYPVIRQRRCRPFVGRRWR